MEPQAPIPTALELLDYFGIAVFAISGALLATAAALAAGLSVGLVLLGVSGAAAAAVAAVAGFGLRGMAIARGWSLLPYRD